MKLVVLTKNFGNYTGATVSTLEILKRISMNFECVKVITLKSENIHIQNVDVEVVKNYTMLLKKLSKLHHYIGYSDDHLGFLFSLFSIPYIHTYHGNWPDAKWLSLNMFLKSFVFIPLYILTVRNAEYTASVSEYMKENFTNKHTNNSIVIYNGIKQKSGRSCYEKKANRFIMVGNIDLRKYKKAIKIFNILKKKKFQGNIDIYGSLLNKVIVRKLDGYSFVKVKGPVNEVPYSNYDALICTSISENLPVSIVEAVLNNVFILSFDIGGINEVVSKGISGYLFAKNNYNEFAMTILHFNTKRIPKRELGRIDSRFNWNNSVKFYNRLFEKISGKQ